MRSRPYGESLEMRDCPSGLAAQVAIERHEQALIAREHRLALLRASEYRKLHQEGQKATQKKAVAGAPQTIYVAPKGKTGTTAGKTAAHPLGSLTLAIKRAAPGSTIVLAPGVYALDVKVMGKSNLTFQGAANGTSVIDPSSGNAMLVQSSSNVTINNVVFHAPGGGSAGIIVQGSSVNLNNVQTSNTTGYGVIAGSYGGLGSSVNVAGSQFSGSQNADGFHLSAGASATITGSVFDDNGSSTASDSNGLALDGGSSATITGSSFNGNASDGLFAAGNAQVTISNSTFNGSRMGSGIQLNDSATASITGSTFNGNGTAAGVTQSSNGAVIGGSSSATIVGSQFDANTNGGMVVSNSANVSVSQSTFTGNVKGDGAIFFQQATVKLTGNTFASNGQTVGISSGLNGVEFFINYTGNAVVSGNTFQSNTANGLYVGSAGSLVVSDNQFLGNVDGLFLDGTAASINASIVGNTIVASTTPGVSLNGMTLVGQDVTATIGGSGGDANTIENFAQGDYITEALGTGAAAGLPHATILANSYLDNGQAVTSSYAIFVQ